ncbi:MAG TPA: hypothetical protein VFB31_05485, partial [Pseudolabrys sp.]|nr:hypothetical protein [Pseudolabrys sp.]
RSASWAKRGLAQQGKRRDGAPQGAVQGKTLHATQDRLRRTARRPLGIWPRQKTRLRRTPRRKEQGR